MKKNKTVTAAIIILAAVVLGIAFTACGEDDDGGSAWTVNIMNFDSADIKQNIGSKWMVGVYAIGTSDAAVKTDAQAYLAGGGSYSEGLKARGTNESYNLSGLGLIVKLYKAPGFNEGWSGSGNYDIWLLGSPDGTTANVYGYKAANEPITEPATAVSVNTTPVITPAL